MISIALESSLPLMQYFIFKESRNWSNDDLVQSFFGGNVCAISHIWCRLKCFVNVLHLYSSIKKSPQYCSSSSLSSRKLNCLYKLKKLMHETSVRCFLLSVLKGYLKVCPVGSISAILSIIGSIFIKKWIPFIYIYSLLWEKIPNQLEAMRCCWIELELITSNFSDSLKCLNCTF